MIIIGVFSKMIWIMQPGVLASSMNVPLLDIPYAKCDSIFTSFLFRDGARIGRSIEYVPRSLLARRPVDFPLDRNRYNFE
jgi:hypothetical protein